MCLDAVHEKTVRVTKGWKGFSVHDGDSKELQVRSLVQGKKTPIPLGVWVNEVEYRVEAPRWYGSEKLKADDCRFYPMGWHVSRTKSGLKLWVDKSPYSNDRIAKVEVRGIVASGLQDDYVFCISKEIRIVALYHPCNMRVLWSIDNEA